jgi:succinate dehydrogenase / fumarate reductase membrane anchor subunit
VNLFKLVKFHQFLFYFSYSNCNGYLLVKGSTIWYLQRCSSIFIFIYIIYVVVFIISSLPIAFNEWFLFKSSLLFKLSTTTAFLSILVHAYIGLWTIGTDYLTPRTLGFLNFTLSKIADTSRLLYNILFTVLGLLLYFYLLLLVWI